MIRIVLVVLFSCGLVPAQATGNIEGPEAEAQRLLKARDAAGALEKYRGLAKLKPDSAKYEDEIGFILAGMNRTGEAIPHFERATNLDPRFADAYYHLGVALWLVQRADAAIDANAEGG